MGSRRKRQSDFDFDTEPRGNSSRLNESSSNDSSVKINSSDFEGIFRKFSGDETMSVRVWTQEFERYANTFKLNDLEKFIFCKRLLCGSAKLYVECEVKPTNYNDLKHALYAEFSSKVSAAEVHRKLRERKKRNDETYREYLYKMIDIASQSEVDDLSVISYVIGGISDVGQNKAILYGTKTIAEFKEKLTIYEKIKIDSVRQNAVTSKDGNKPKISLKSEKIVNVKHCYNCGSRDHTVRECPQKEKGPKCFRCNNYGHRQMNCPATSKNSVSTNIIVKNDMHLIIKVNGVMLKCLVDTGSEICVIKDKFLPLIKPINFSRLNSISVSGLGANILTKGSCKANIEINNEIYDDVEVHVVNNNHMRPDFILGMSVLSRSIVNINGGKITINKLKSPEGKIEASNLEEQTSACFLAAIKVDNDESVINSYLSASNPNQKAVNAEILKLMQRYEPAVPPCSPIQMKIVTTDDEPVYRPPRRFPLEERKIIDKQISEWLKDGVVRESTSDYASQVLLVKKKDGTHRLCVDYRAVNRKIYKERYPLPNIEDQIDKLQGSKYFTTLDLENGFFHVTVEESSRKYTSFVTQNGQYEFNRVPFGLCNSPSVFQKYINFIFRDFINENIIVVYIDDIIIPSSTAEEGLNRLKLVLQRAEKHGLKIKWSKCHFLQTEVEYLGHCIRAGSVLPATAKVKAVTNFPVPSTQKQLQSFLGLASYFRKFIPDFAVRARSLMDLLKKDSHFKIEKEHLTAINDLKNALATRPVLKIFTYGATTELHTDASREGYGAVLLQKDPEDNALHPVFYMSKRTTEAEKNYTSYELEVLAVIEALKKFRVYLLGQRFKLVTDCKAFECTMKKKDLATRVARWALLLEEYDYVIKHRTGSRMKHVDALSRNPIIMCIDDNATFLKKLAAAQEEDVHLRAIIELLKKEPFGEYSINHGILYKNINNTNLFVVPDVMKNSVIKQVHEKGHFGLRKMKELIDKEFYIPDFQQRAKRIIAGCVKCILALRKTGKGEGMLQPLPKGEHPLDTFHVDHLGPLHDTKKNYRYIFAVIDGFTKYCWLFPTKTLNADEVIQKLEVIAETFGYPRYIISDRGGAFISNLFSEYCREREIKHHFITVGVPRGNGQVERLHATVISALTKLSINDQDKWFTHVRPVQQMLNASYHRAIKMTPFELLVGTKMRTKEDLQIKEIIEEEYIKQFDDVRRELRDEAKRAIKEIQDENRRTFNKKRRIARMYKVGDKVAVERVQYGTGLKIRPKFLGPYRVIAVKGFDRYKVQKEGEHEGPRVTSCSADKMKFWDDSDELEDYHANDDDEEATAHQENDRYRDEELADDAEFNEIEKDELL